MNKLIMITLAVFFQINLSGQSKSNMTLQKQIFTMFETDQKWRAEYNKINSGESSDYDQATIENEWAKADKINLALAKKIVSQYGFPGYNLAGREGSNKFWAIIQHCDDDLQFQKKALELMELQVKKQ